MAIIDTAAPSHRSRTGFALAALVAAAVAMGASPLFVRLAEVGPYTSAFWRVALALPLLFLWARLEPPMSGAAKPRALPTVLAGLAFAGDLFFWHLAIVHTTIANATFLATMAPVWVLLLSGFLIGERTTRKMMAGLALCLVGAAFLLGGSFQAAPERLRGDAFGLATSLFFGLYFLAVRVARRGAASGELLFRSTLVTAAALFVVALVMENAWWPATLGGAAALVAMAAVSHVGGQGLLAFALGHLSAGFSSLVIFLEAVAAAGLAWIFVGEPLGVLQAAGGAAILAGIVVARPPPDADPAAPAHSERKPPA